jgi:hypothetical protein
LFINLITIYRNFYRRLLRNPLGLALIPITILLLIGTFGYAFLEGWTLLVVLAIWRNGDYLYSPAPNTTLQAADELIVFAVSDDRDIFGEVRQSQK